ncbi:MAG TPA: methyltransferase [Solirubrobacteraceae bacterium]|nr:methyltransferase [Solirubrobacteraceae bacterium]
MNPRLAALVERGALAADAAVGLPPPYPAAYIDAWISLIRARTLISAVRLGVFEALPGSTQQIADRCECDPERIEVLLEALAALRYVRGRWHATRRARAHFGVDPAIALPATVGELSAAAWHVLEGLEDVMRGGRAPGLHGGVADPEVFAGYQAAMTELMSMSGPVVVRRLRRPARLLDIGGGPGTFAALACRRWPHLQATIADFPDAAALGRERIAEAGLSGRVRYVEGDARESEVGGGYDAVTLLSVLHNLDRETGVELLRAAGAAAAPRGRVVVFEIEGTRTQIGTMASVAFCAWMGARAYTAGQLAEMAAEAGLRRVRVRRPARLAGSVILIAAPG